MSEWQHKDIWTKRGENFLVQVSRHEHSGEPLFGEGKHRWCVYAYIYPKHGLFKSFSGDEMWQDAAMSLPLHRGPSFLQWHYNSDMTPTSIQVGCDYNHLHDEEYTHMGTRERAAPVFRGASELFEYLTKARGESE